MIKQQKFERKFNCRPLERIQEPHLPLNRFVTMITVALENRKDRLYHLTYIPDITWLNVIGYIITRSLAFYCPTQCSQPFGQDYKRSQPVWMSFNVRRCAKKYSISICQLIPGLYMHLNSKSCRRRRSAKTRSFCLSPCHPPNPAAWQKNLVEIKNGTHASATLEAGWSLWTEKRNSTSTWKKNTVQYTKVHFVPTSQRIFWR